MATFTSTSSYFRYATFINNSFRWAAKSVSIEVLLLNASAVWVGNTTSNYICVLAESVAIPDNFWASARVCSDSSGRTLGFLLKTQEGVTLRTFDIRSGNFICDSTFSDVKEPCHICNFPDNITWITAHGEEIVAARSTERVVLPPEPLSPLSYPPFLIVILFFDGSHIHEQSLCK